MRIGVVGINHKLADLKLREKLAKACQRRFGSSCSTHCLHYFILLSTCNRTEIYFSSDDLTQTHTYILNILRNDVKEEFEHKLYSYFGLDCFNHLTQVTAGLDSAVLAETEIQGQVKKAYEAGVEYIQLPYDLHFLFQKSLKIAKEVRTTFNLEKGRPSLEQAILNIGTQLFKSNPKIKILFVGASEINQKILQYMRSKNQGNITLCNRSNQYAEAIAKSQNVLTLAWNAVSQWHEYDWIIFGTKSPDFLLTKEDLPSKFLSHKLIIDLCVPRNVDPKISDEQITLLNIDQINRTLKIRKQTMQHLLFESDLLISQETKKQQKLFKEKQLSKLRLTG